MLPFTVDIKVALLLNNLLAGFSLLTFGKAVSDQNGEQIVSNDCQFFKFHPADMLG